LIEEDKESKESMLSKRDNRSTDLNVIDKEDDIISLEEHEPEEPHVEEKLEDTDKELIGFISNLSRKWYVIIVWPLKRRSAYY